MAKYEISEHVKNNILVFLDRVDLKGVEVNALVEIKYVLMNPIKEEDNTKE